MKVAVKLKNNVVENYCYLANEDYSDFINTHEIVEISSLNEIIDGKTRVVDGVIDNSQDYTKEYLLQQEAKKEEERINYLRAKRSKLLTAFDKYKSNVYYGIEVETETSKKAMITYYNKLLELNEEAINNPPERIRYYL